ncbi:MAG: prolyl oligopeptidase family serine peptidase [Pseudomonadota bacterium]
MRTMLVRSMVLSLGALLGGLASSAGAADAADAAGTGVPSGGAKALSDPYLWLEDVEGERALAWARERNERSLGELRADPRFPRFEADARAILEAQDRIPDPVLMGGRVYNFWQDATNVRGLLRRADWASWESGEPRWETVLDVDALSAKDGKRWVTGMPRCLPPEYRRCLVTLSDGGKDAALVREFDVETREFVAGGVTLPEAKSQESWLDADTLAVATDWGPGTMTESGYPFVMKLWRRGQPLSAATEVFRGTPRDVGIFPVSLRDRDGTRVLVMARLETFFESTQHVLVGERTVQLPVPRRASVQGLWKGQLVVSLEEPWRVPAAQVAVASGAAEVEFPKGAVVSFALRELLDGGRLRVHEVYRPGPRESFQSFGGAKSSAFLLASDNVVTRAHRYDFADGRWTRLGTLALPEGAQVTAGDAEVDDDRAFFYAEGFLVPRSLWLADAATGAVKPVDEMPPRFDASKHVVEQFEATSKDGTKVPYFVVRPKDLEYDGAAPTLLYAYGGFQVPMPPAYSGTLGKLWLESGGVYVLANIRGGGEFGPAWHQAGLKTKRQVIYDDFVAVAEDLVARKITTPRRLGIMGGSNGGLLMGVMLTQRPDLWNAVVVQVPLLDMLRYHLLLAGASWVDEYGSPDVPEERAFLERISPYHNLRAGVRYPPPFFVTSTKDDRVHPAHARKTAARLEELGQPYYYYENMDGGHAAASDQRERAKRIALEFTYLSRRLKD